MEVVMKYECRKCHREYEEGSSEWKCSCGGSLWLKQGKIKFTKDGIRKDDCSMWRYDQAYPIKRSQLAATFGEGMTPLTLENWEDVPVYIKNDALMPTGSFKDRGVVMMINSMALMGVPEITEDSSGNAGASVAAYAAKAGIKCNIYVPESTSEGKVTQITAAGAKLHKIPGLRDCAAKAAQAGVNGVYASHNWNPYFVEGVKSMAYEIWEQLGFEAPDNIICPIGNGSIALGLVQGFSELVDNEEASKLPRVYGVQPKNCNPICRKFYGESEMDEAVETIAEGIALRFSSKADEVVDAIRTSHGIMLDVSEDEILQALRTVCGKGFYIEPTSCATFAGATKLIASGAIKRTEKTVIVISGNGLKASGKIFDYLRKEAGV